jgi:hypothetical protein
VLDYPFQTTRSGLERSGGGGANSAVLLLDDAPPTAFSAKNPVFHDRSKHIDIQYHFTRDLLKEKIGLNYVPTTEVVADLLTKSLPRTQHEHLSVSLGLQRGRVSEYVIADNRVLIVSGPSTRGTRLFDLSLFIST